MELTIEQQELIKQYLDLVETVDEGLQYVISSFSDYEKTEGERILNDIFSAFIQIGESNSVFINIIKDEFIIDTFNRFQAVMEQALKLNGHLNDPNEKESVVREGIYPLFSEWKTNIQNDLQPYILN